MILFIYNKTLQFGSFSSNNRVNGGLKRCFYVGRRLGDRHPLTVTLWSLWSFHGVLNWVPCDMGWCAVCWKGVLDQCLCDLFCYWVDTIFSCDVLIHCWLIKLSLVKWYSLTILTISCLSFSVWSYVLEYWLWRGIDTRRLTFPLLSYVYILAGNHIFRSERFIHSTFKLIR